MASRNRSSTVRHHAEIPLGPEIDHEALRALVRRRAGVVRTTELARVLGDRPAARRLPAALPRLLPGVIFAAARSPTVRDRRLAALRYAGPGALLTGLTALRLYGLRKLPAEWEVHVLVPARRRRRSSSYALLERTSRLPAHRWRDGLPCAPPARAVVDATRRLRDPDVMRGLLVQVLDRELCTVADLATELRAAEGPGLARPRLRFTEIREERARETRARLRTLLERARIPPPLWDPPLAGDPVAHWPDRKVVLVLDLSAWALSPSAALAIAVDAHRLRRCGNRVVAVTPDDLARRPAHVLSTIAGAVRPASMRQAPPRRPSGPTGAWPALPL